MEDGQKVSCYILYVFFKYWAYICSEFFVFVFNVAPTAKVIWRRGHGLKSHPTKW